jgi:aminopeptidase N
MRRGTASLVLCSIPVLIMGCTTDKAGPPAPAPAPMAPTTGAAGAGDEYYPNDGNGGYDALDYHVNVGFDPATQHLDGDTTVTARATQDLSRFNLDLRGLDVKSVQVNDEPAKFTREGEFELVVTPAGPLANGSMFRTRVLYSGTPTGVQQGAIGESGWQKSASGGAYVVGEPHSAAYWYPVNETPRDKAAFNLTARVPDGWSAISNGREDGITSAGGWTTSAWSDPNPVASYLTTLAVDKFTFDRTTLPGGIPVVDAYAHGAEPRRAAGSQLPAVLAFLASKFGPYPQSAAGGIYLDENLHFSLETQTRPTYARWADIDTVVHESAHQWFGNSVSVESWADICLNECFASYAQWLWEEKGGSNLDDRYRRAVEMNRNSAGFWSPKLTGMGAGHEFEGVYDKGTLAVHALRGTIGEEVFGRVLREWPAKYRHGNASWADFEAFVTGISGKDLHKFFDAWFRGTTLPGDADLYPG